MLAAFVLWILDFTISNRNVEKKDRVHWIEFIYSVELCIIKYNFHTICIRQIEHWTVFFPQLHILTIFYLATFFPVFFPECMNGSERERENFSDCHCTLHTVLSQVFFLSIFSVGLVFKLCINFFSLHSSIDIYFFMFASTMHT